MKMKDQKDEKQEAVALLRHQIISPVLMESGRAQMSYFRTIENQEFDVPGSGVKRFKASTMKGWLKRYRKDGFKGLVPQYRSDRGRYRRVTLEIEEAIKKLRSDHMGLSVLKFYEKALQEEVLGNPPLCLETCRRVLRRNGLYITNRTKPRKRFEMSRFGELWTGDFMHGPQVLESFESGKRKKKKAILMAIVDDHTRMMVGAEFGFFENTTLLERVFKDSILTYGCPERLYVDNGAAFSSHYLRRVCAHMGIGLVHSKPYDSPSRGKIERFFRTVRSSFLSTLHEDAEIDLKTLNAHFETWLRDHYHHKHHSGIGMRPIDRYQHSLSQYPLKRVDEDTLDEFFMVSVERTVNKDSTLSFKGKIYETPPQFIGKKVEIRFVQERENEVYLYQNGMRVQKLMLVDAHENGKIYRPTNRISDIALHQIKVQGNASEQEGRQ
jgi:putative transposase